MNIPQDQRPEVRWFVRCQWLPLPIGIRPERWSLGLRRQGKIGQTVLRRRI